MCDYLVLFIYITWLFLDETNTIVTIYSIDHLSQ